MIELATEKEHLDGANYIVTINSRKSVAADTVEDVWRIIGESPFGSCYSIHSPAGLNTAEFVPF